MGVAMEGTINLPYEGPFVHHKHQQRKWRRPYKNVPLRRENVSLNAKRFVKRSPVHSSVTVCNDESPQNISGTLLLDQTLKTQKRKTLVHKKAQ